MSRPPNPQGAYPSEDVSERRKVSQPSVSNTPETASTSHSFKNSNNPVSFGGKPDAKPVPKISNIKVVPERKKPVAQSHPTTKNEKDRTSQFTKPNNSITSRPPIADVSSKPQPASERRFRLPSRFENSTQSVATQNKPDKPSLAFSHKSRSAFSLKIKTPSMIQGNIKSESKPELKIASAPKPEPTPKPEPAPKFEPVQRQEIHFEHLSKPEQSLEVGPASEPKPEPEPQVESLIKPHAEPCIESQDELKIEPTSKSEHDVSAPSVSPKEEQPVPPLTKPENEPQSELSKKSIEAPKSSKSNDAPEQVAASHEEITKPPLVQKLDLSSFEDPKQSEKMSQTFEKRLKELQEIFETSTLFKLLNPDSDSSIGEDFSFVDDERNHMFSPAYLLGCRAAGEFGTDLDQRKREILEQTFEDANVHYDAAKLQSQYTKTGVLMVTKDPYEEALREANYILNKLSNENEKQCVKDLTVIVNKFNVECSDNKEKLCKFHEELITEIFHKACMENKFRKIYSEFLYDMLRQYDSKTGMHPFNLLSTPHYIEILREYPFRANRNDYANLCLKDINKINQKDIKITSELAYSRSLHYMRKKMEKLVQGELIGKREVHHSIRADETLTIQEQDYRKSLRIEHMHGTSEFISELFNKGILGISFVCNVIRNHLSYNVRNNFIHILYNRFPKYFGAFVERGILKINKSSTVPHVDRRLISSPGPECYKLSYTFFIRVKKLFSEGIPGCEPISQAEREHILAEDMYTPQPGPGAYAWEIEYFDSAIIIFRHAFTKFKYEFTQNPGDFKKVFWPIYDFCNKLLQFAIKVCSKRISYMFDLYYTPLHQLYCGRSTPRQKKVARPSRDSSLFAKPSMSSRPERAHVPKPPIDIKDSYKIFMEKLPVHEKFEVVFKKLASNREMEERIILTLLEDLVVKSEETQKFMPIRKSFFQKEIKNGLARQVESFIKTTTPDEKTHFIQNCVKTVSADLPNVEAKRYSEFFSFLIPSIQSRRLSLTELLACNFTGSNWRVFAMSLIRQFFRLAESDDFQLKEHFGEVTRKSLKRITVFFAAPQTKRTKKSRRFTGELGEFADTVEILREQQPDGFEEDMFLPLVDVYMPLVCENEEHLSAVFGPPFAETKKMESILFMRAFTNALVAPESAGPTFVNVAYRLRTQPNSVFAASDAFDARRVGLAVISALKVVGGNTKAAAKMMFKWLIENKLLDPTTFKRESLPRFSLGTSAWEGFEDLCGKS
eukprot:gnl/Chilomastix_cuspidata/3391.p1 GENE.gnl/Chilomastix_cuspidata/3391~~gnl/Chilomastix_cuspidata/3391.p1  ORF type:complete len:1240 (-),score=151.36 gnl/Chilomastix_cuspidata/3391:11-3730(-)